METLSLLRKPASGFRLLRYEQLIARVADAFGDEIKGSKWLSLPSADLGGRTPLEVAEEHGYGVESIDPILVRIEHGIDF